VVKSFNLSFVICHLSLSRAPWLLAIGYSRSDSCPEAGARFVVSLNMNTDYGFFQLFRALKSLRDNKNKWRFCEKPSEVEEGLPQINYWLLTSLPVHQQRYQQNSFRWERCDFGVTAGTACPDYNS
jgi:hypothetical protein